MKLNLLHYYHETKYQIINKFRYLLTERSLPMTDNIIHRFRFFLSTNLHYFIAYAFLGFLILLPFYDSNNIPLNFASVEAMLNSSPPLDVVRWAGGPFTMSIFVPAFLTYVFSDFNIYYSLLFYKLLFLFLNSLLGLIISRMTEDIKKRKSVFLFILLNPVLIVVNYIWVEIDIFPIFFFTLFYFLLRYRGNIQTLETVVLSFSLCIAVLFYWYPLLFIPTLILYSKRGQNLKALICAVLVTSIAIILTVAIISTNLVSATLSLAGASSITRIQISGIQHFITIGNHEYIILLGFLTLVVPFVLRKTGFSEPFALLFIIIIVLVSSNFTTPDNDLFIIPMCFIPILRNRRLKVSIKRLLLAEIFPIVALFFLAFYIGNTLPDGVGIFYWGYDIFHSNIIFLHTQTQLFYFLFVFNLFLITSVVFTLIYLGIVDKKSVLVKSVQSSSQTPSNKGNRPHLRIKNYNNHVKKIFITTTVVILVLMPISFLFNADEPVIVSINNDGNFPTYYFNPLLYPSNGNIVRPIENTTFMTDRNSIEIFCNSPSMSLGRNFSGMIFNFSSTFNFNSKISNISALLIASPQFNLSLDHYLLPDFNYPNSLVLNYSKNSAREVLSIDKKFPNLFKISKGEQVEYRIDHPDSSGYFFFMFTQAEHGVTRSCIFHAQNNDSFVSLLSDNGQLILTYSDNNTCFPSKIVNIHDVNISNNWNYVTLHPSFNSTHIIVNGHYFNIDVNPLLNTTLFNFGPPPSETQSNLSCSETVTQFYYSNSYPTFSPMNMINFYSNDGNKSFYTKSNLFTISVNSIKNGTHVHLLNQSFYFADTTTNFLFGKLSPGQYSLRITLNHFGVELFKNGIYLIPIFWVVVLPFIVLTWLLMSADIVVIKKLQSEIQK